MFTKEDSHVWLKALHKIKNVNSKDYKKEDSNGLYDKYIYLS